MRTTVVAIAVVTAWASGTSPSTLAGPCIPHWDAAVGNPGLDNYVLTLSVFDDGAGPQLYAGGGFTTAGGKPALAIARWNGVSWSALGSGLGPGNGGVWAMTSFDDGGGPALYAGGDFGRSGGTTVNRIARWDGQEWQPVGGGVNLSIRGAMVAFDDGSGPALYVGGDFTTAGGSPAIAIARWNGTSWSAVGGGMAGMAPTVRAFAVFDDGKGPALYAGGAFSSAGGQPASFVAKWDGHQWSSLGDGTNGLVRALGVFDDGSGPALYAGGDFTQAGGSPAERIARWDGSQWSSVGGGTSATVRSIVPFAEGGRPRLFVSGDFQTAGSVTVNGVGRWDGTRWSALSGAMDDIVHALAAYGSGNGASLFAGGFFRVAEGQLAKRIARWQPCGPTPVSGGNDAGAQPRE